MKSNDAITALAAIAHEGRLEIFRLLMRRAPAALAAGEIAAALGVRATTLSNQLTVLEHAGLVASSREGRSVLYRAHLDQAAALITFLTADCCRGRSDVCHPAAAAFLARQAALGHPLDRPRGVLFLCTGNSARSIFAEAILNGLAPNRFIAYSAGASPTGAVAPMTLELLESLEYETGALRSKSWSAFSASGAPTLDFVITVCDQAANEPCPIWPGQPAPAHWGVPDPAAARGGAEDRRVAFAAAYSTLYNRIKAFVDLPLDQLDQLALQQRLDAIGALPPQTEPPAALFSATA